METFDEYRARLGSHIRALRAPTGLSQERLGGIVGISRVEMGYIEQGARTPRLETLYNLADALNVSMRDMLP